MASLCSLCLSRGSLKPLPASRPSNFCMGSLFKVLWISWRNPGSPNHPHHRVRFLCAADARPTRTIPSWGKPKSWKGPAEAEELSWQLLYHRLRLRQMRYLNAKSTQYCRHLVVIYICNKSTNKDTSQHASINNKTGIHYNNLRPQMGVLRAWYFIY